MPYKTDRERSLKDSLELYRPAVYSDIMNPRILGFYRRGGEYYRKNGAPRMVSNFTVVNVLRGANESRIVTRWNYKRYFIRLDEILSDENAPPKHFKLTRITMDMEDAADLQKFAYLLGARGYLQPELYTDDQYAMEVSLSFLEPILIPPTRLLNLLDDCIAAQKGWGETT